MQARNATLHIAEQTAICGVIAGARNVHVQSLHRVPLAVKGALEAFAAVAAVADGRPGGAALANRRACLLYTS